MSDCYVFIIKCNLENSMVVKFGKDIDKIMKSFTKKVPEDIEHFEGIHKDGVVWKEKVQSLGKARSLYSELDRYPQEKLKRLVDVQVRYLL